MNLKKRFCLIIYPQEGTSLGGCCENRFQVAKFLPVTCRPSEACDFRRPVVSRRRIDNLFYRPPRFRILRPEIVDFPLDFLIGNSRIIDEFFIWTHKMCHSYATFFDADFNIGHFNTDFHKVCRRYLDQAYLHRIDLNKTLLLHSFAFPDKNVYRNM